MAQAAANPTTSFSRRSLIGFTAAALLPANAGSAERHDPIFRAIARHKLAESALDAALEQADRSEKTVDDRHPAEREVRQTSAALLTTMPTTQGGVAALLWYFHENHRQDMSLSRDAFTGRAKRTAIAAFKHAKVA